MRPTLEDIELALRKSWCQETAQVASSWDPQNPAAGQCWQSAFVVRHYFGGDIILAEVLPLTEPISRHAWNRLLDGREVDLSRSQFAEGQTFRLCTVSDEIVWKIVGSQAELLLCKVKSALCLDAESLKI